MTSSNPRFLVVACFLAGLSLQASAQPAEVDLELVLAVDVSRSMDFEEQRVQREGYVAAFRHPEVISAIESGVIGRIAVTYMEWAGSGLQNVIVPWTIIGNADEAAGFAENLEIWESSYARGTSISLGLAAAAALFADSGVTGLRRAIDISGDGPNNMGPPVAQIRDKIVAQGIAINGLPIMLRPSMAGMRDGPFGISNLDAYYEDCVIGGPGAFMIAVTDETQFPGAIRRKLVLEIVGLEPELRFTRVSSAEPRVDCLVGEKARGRWFMEEFR